MRIQDKEEQIISIRQERDSLNDLLEELEGMESEWCDSGASLEDMKSIRKKIGDIIYQRDKCDDKLDELGEVRLIMTPIQISYFSKIRLKKRFIIFTNYETFFS